MSEIITQGDALQHINYYRQDIEPGDLKSVWIDKSIIDFIVANASQLSGLRIYLARYKDGVYPTTVDPSLADKDTLIAVPTQNIDGTNEDREDGYFDYNELCPPTCKGDSGN